MNFVGVAEFPVLAMLIVMYYIKILRVCIF